MYLYKVVLCVFLSVLVSQCHENNNSLAPKEEENDSYSYNAEYFDENQNKGYGYKVRVKGNEKKNKGNSWSTKQDSSQSTTVKPAKSEEFKPSPRGPQIYIESTSGKILHFSDLTQNESQTKNYKTTAEEDQYKPEASSETFPKTLPFIYSQPTKQNSQITTPQFQKFSAEDGLMYPTREYKSQRYHTASQGRPEQNIYVTERPSINEYYNKNYQNSQTIKPTQVHHGATEQLKYEPETYYSTENNGASPEKTLKSYESTQYYSTEPQVYTAETNGALPEKTLQTYESTQYYSTEPQGYAAETNEASPEKSLKSQELNQYYSRTPQVYTGASPEKSLKSHELNKHYSTVSQAYLAETSGDSPEKSHGINEYYSTVPQVYTVENSGASPEKSLNQYYSSVPQVYTAENNKASPEKSLKSLELNQYYSTVPQVYTAENSEAPSEKTHGLYYSTNQVFGGENKGASPENENELYYRTRPHVYATENSGVLSEKLNSHESNQYYSNQPQVYTENSVKLLKGKYFQPALVYSTGAQVNSMRPQVESTMQFVTETPVGENDYYSPLSKENALKGQLDSNAGLYYSPKHYQYPQVYSPANQVTTTKETFKYFYEPPKKVNHEKTYELPDHRINGETKYAQKETQVIYGSNKEASQYSGAQYLPTQNQEASSLTYSSGVQYLPQETHGATTHESTVEAPNTQKLNHPIRLNTNEYLLRNYGKAQYSKPKEYGVKYGPSHPQQFEPPITTSGPIGPREQKSLSYSDYYYMPIQNPYRTNYQKMPTMYNNKQMIKPKIMVVVEPRFEYNYENKAYANLNNNQNQYKPEMKNVEHFHFPAEP